MTDQINVELDEEEAESSQTRKDAMYLSGLVLLCLFLLYFDPGGFFALVSFAGFFIGLLLIVELLKNIPGKEHIGDKIDQREEGRWVIFSSLFKLAGSLYFMYCILPIIIMVVVVFIFFILFS